MGSPPRAATPGWGSRWAAVARTTTLLDSPKNMHIRSWRLQLQAAVLMPRRFTHGQDITDGTQRRYVGLFVGWIGHSQVDINDILSRQAEHRGRTDMLDGQHPRAQCPPNACSEFGKTIRPLSVVGNNLDRLDRRRPVDPWIVI